MFASSLSSPLDNLFNNSNSSLSSVSNNVEQNMQQINQQVQSGEIINPASLLNMQINVQNYTLLVGTISSLIKANADAQKSIAQNIGS